MYFSGKLSINPTQATEIDIIKPTKAFSRILNFVTAGSLDKKLERETFTAISILQQFNAVFRSLNITNIIRLSYNDIPLYEDKDGVDDDLAVALDTFELEMDDMTSELFKTIGIVLEHHDANFQYLLEVDIKREHAVGEDPIVFQVNALLNELNTSKSEQSAVEAKLKSDVFTDQAQYDAFLAAKQKEFDGFMQTLELEIRKFIHSEALSSKTSKKLIRPSSKSSTRNYSPGDHTPEPVFGNYAGSNVGDFLFFSLLWSQMTHAHGIHVYDTSIVTDEGEQLVDVGSDGLESGQESILDGETDLDVIPLASRGDFTDSSETSDFSFFSSDFGDSDAGCSSCSGCGGD